MRIRFICFLGISFLFLAACSKNESGHTLFQLLDSTQTNINFINRLDEKKNGLTPLEYLYYYNGAGVAAGDVNKDGLADLFFVSNHHGNKLFINQGNFRFKDISATAGIAGYSQWKTGASMIDINADGWLDIYICAVSNYKTLEGSNELYINNGDNTFTEKSAEYGLDFTGMATQSAFFDYDHDGDLDMYLLTHVQQTARSYDRVLASSLPEKASQDRLYKNDNGQFRDVSIQAGLDSSFVGYGLGITVADLNADGWEDLYIAHDFGENDLCYINQGDGTFKERGKELFDYFSRYAHGCDAADLDNDGYEDVITTDIHAKDERVEKTTQGDDPWEVFHYKRFLGHYPQFSRNVLQRNEEGFGFTEVGAFAGIDATDWTWSVLMADYNNDGRKDIFTTNGIPRRLNDLNFLAYAHKDSLRYALDLSELHIQRALNMMEDGRSRNAVFKNEGGLHFSDQSEQWGMVNAGYAQGAAYADLDNDGDLDIITNNLDEPACLYRNQTREQNPDNHYLTVLLKGKEKNIQGIGAKVYVKTAKGSQLQHMMPTRGYLSSVNGPLHFGLDSISSVDSLIVVWPDQTRQILKNVKANQLITIDAAQGSRFTPPRGPSYSSPIKLTEWIADTGFKHHENEFYDFYREPLIPFLLSREGPALAVGDVNGDGLDDYYIGGAKHQSGALFVQREDGSFIPSPQTAFTTDAVYEDVDACWLDADQDHDLDLYVVSGGNEFYGDMKEQADRLYVNDGKGNFKRDATALPTLLQIKSCVRPYDVDGDGDQDLFVGGRVTPFQYGAPASSFILINNGHGKFADETALRSPSFKALGMVTDAQWKDIDQDGDADLVVAGDWMSLKIFLNEKGKLQELTDWIDEHSPIKNMNGLWHALAVDDFDKDGDNDIIAGNLGLNTSLRRDGDQSAIRLYTSDLNADGKRESILARRQPDGRYYSVAQYEEMARLMPPAFQKEFPTPAAYAGTDMETLATRCGITWETPLYVDQFASLYMENLGGRKFVLKTLPDEAQHAPLYALCSDDLDHDGIPDLIAGGNTTGVSPIQGMYTANHGLILRGNRGGNFTPLSARQSGFYIKGVVRQIKSVQRKKDRIYLVARNNDTIKIFINAFTN